METHEEYAKRVYGWDAPLSPERRRYIKTLRFSSLYNGDLSRLELRAMAHMAINSRPALELLAEPPWHTVRPAPFPLKCYPTPKVDTHELLHQTVKVSVPSASLLDYEVSVYGTGRTSR